MTAGLLCRLREYLMCEETSLPDAVTGAVAFVVLVLFELCLSCLVWGALKKGWIDVLVPGGIHRRDNPAFFWLFFAGMVFATVLLTILLALPMLR